MLNRASLDSKVDTVSDAPLGSPRTLPVPKPSAFLLAARSLGRMVIARRDQAPQGSFVWPPAVPLEEDACNASRNRIGPDGVHDLFLGNPGVGMAMVAIGRQLDDSSFVEAGRGAVIALRQRVLGIADRDGDLDDPIVRMGIGGVVGLSGLLYAFLEIGTLLEESDWHDLAHQLTPLFDSARIELDHSYDVVLGSAGAILALLAMAELRPGASQRGQTPLAIAIACGEHLLRAPVPTDPGFSHGAAGIGLALGKLSAATGDERYWRRALDCLSGAGRLLDAAERASADAKASGRQVTDAMPDSWCHGTGGLALACLQVPTDLANDHQRRILGQLAEAALERLRTAPPGHLDHLCCGNVGRAEILLSAYRTSHDERWLHAAEEVAGEVLVRLSTTGRLRGDYPGRLDTSLFRGISGIARTFAHLGSPGCLGTPLALELSRC